MGRWQLVASPDGAASSLRIEQDCKVYLATIDSGRGVSHEFEPDRHGWVQVLRGTVELNEQLLEAGDGAAISEEPKVTLKSPGTAEVMLFDLS